MKFKCTARCHYCRVPLNPYIEVIGMFDYLKILTWSHICPINVVANDQWLRVLGPSRTVRVCKDCWDLRNFKVKLRGILNREVMGRIPVKEPLRLAVGDNYMLDWLKHMDEYNRQSDALTFYDLDLVTINQFGPKITLQMQ